MSLIARAPHSSLARRARSSDLPREVWVLAAIAFSVALGFGIVAPIIPVFAREFGVGQTAAGLVVSTFAFTRLVFGPAGGALVNRFGERAVMASGFAIVAASSLLTGLAQSFGQMLTARAVGGLGSVMFTVAAHALLLRSVPGHLRGRASGMYSSGFLVGGLTGPLLGGLLGAISLRLPFFIYAGTLLLAGTIAMLFLARVEEAEQSGEIPSTPTTLREALGNRSYRAALLAGTGTGWAVWGIRTSLIPLFVVEVLLHGPVWAGFGLLVGSITQVILVGPVGRAADSRGRRPVIIAGTSSGVAASLVLAFVESEAGFLVAMVLFGLTSAAMSVGPPAVVGDVVTGRGGTVVATYGMATDIGAVIGPLVAGLLAEQVSYRAAFLSTAAVLAVGLVAALRMPETLVRRAPIRRVPEPAAD